MFSRSNFYQWGGLAFMFGNVLFLANKINEMSRLFLSRPMADVISGQDTVLIIIGQLALIVGYLAFYNFYAPRLKGSGSWSLRLFRGGGILLAIGHISFMPSLAEFLPPSVRPYAESAFLAVVIGLILLLVGLIWFGILNVRKPVLSGWKWLPLATGLMGFIGFVLFGGEEITTTFLVFRTLFALGLFWLGVTLWRERDAPSRRA